MNILKTTALRLLLIFSVSFLLINPCYNQPDRKRGDIRVMFYNVENLFDTVDNTGVMDEEYTPGSNKRWNSYKYYKKLQAIFKVIAFAGETSPPEVIGLVEIENKKVLEDLISITPLERYNYGIIHYNSPDRRGIDVALLYRKDVMQYVYSKALPVIDESNSEFYTRDILYAALANKKDTFNFYVNHWPSRRGGMERSESKRMLASSVLRNHVDSILSSNANAHIIIGGDFNDEPFNNSIKKGLGAESLANDELESYKLYNLTENLQNDCKCGTYRYKGKWNMLDQLIVSGNLLDDNGVATCTTCVTIARNLFIQVEDSRYGGYQPYRTYLGPRYQGGFSDHFPVIVDFYIESFFR
ncbi:MAG: endonuclease [Bacteroidales bacterium]|nr:endonuclease [Bacteroidales bacterium]